MSLEFLGGACRDVQGLACELLDWRQDPSRTRGHQGWNSNPAVAIRLEIGVNETR